MMFNKLIPIIAFVLTSAIIFLGLSYVFEGKFEISQFEYGAITGVVVWKIKGLFKENE